MRILSEQDVIALKKQGKRFKLKKAPKPKEVKVAPVVKKEPNLKEAIQPLADSFKESIAEIVKESNENAAKSASMVGDLVSKISEVGTEISEKLDVKKSYKCTVQRDRKGLINQIDIIGV